MFERTWTVLVGDMSAPDAGYHFGWTLAWSLTDRPGVLSNDYFEGLLDMGTTWRPSSEDEDIFAGCDRANSDLKWPETRVDPVFGYSCQFRAIAKVCGWGRLLGEICQRFCRYLV